MQVEQSRAESAAEDMTVQNLFDLLADEDPDELDSEARWNKVYEVLPWLLKMLWAFYEDYDGPILQNSAQVSDVLPRWPMIGSTALADDRIHAGSAPCAA